MSDNFVADVDAKIQELQRQMQPLAQQIEELTIARKWFLAMNGKAPAGKQLASEEVSPAQVKQPKATAGTTTRRVIEFAQNALENGVPCRIDDLYEALLLAGIQIGGKAPKIGLSAILSRKKDIFSNDRKRGWTLVRFAQMNDPAAASTAAGSEVRHPAA